MKNLIFFFVVMLNISTCKKKNSTQELVVVEIPPAFTDKFTIYGNKIFKYSNPIQLIGANGFHVFSAGSHDMQTWNIDIVREFVGNVNEQPISGWPIQSSTGAYLHSLQAVVDSNRKDNRITIICAFGWNGNTNTAYTGLRPSQTTWWATHKIRLQQWAAHFKNQQDVWIEVWNEPYRYDRTDGYTDEVWMSDMNEMVTSIRSTGNNNIVLVPCAEQGQDESVLLNKGAIFLQGKKNILFDVHAYEKWLTVSVANMGARLRSLKTNNFLVFIGEVAPKNAGILMNPKPFLDTLYEQHYSTAAWVWKYESNDQDALLDNNGNPNNNNNYNWGTNYKALCFKTRNP